MSEQRRSENVDDRQELTGVFTNHLTVLKEQGKTRPEVLAEWEKLHTRTNDTDGLTKNKAYHDVKKQITSMFDDPNETTGNIIDTTEVVTKPVDGDTNYVNGEKTRLLGIDTAESKAVNRENTQAGKDTAELMRLLVPEGTKVQRSKKGMDKFQRRLADESIVIGDSTVDVGLLLLDQNLTDYYTKFGIHPDPEQHDIYKEYYSENSPYQYGDKRQKLSQEEMNFIGGQISDYKETQEQFLQGKATREELNSAMVSAYSDGNIVAQYRWQLADWDREFKISQLDGSQRMMYDWANQSEENRAKYDSARRQGHNQTYVAPEREPSFWKSLWSNTKTLFTDMNDIAVLGRWDDRNTVRNYGSKERKLEDAELVEGITDPRLKSIILQEAITYGDQPALFRKQQILDGLDRKAIIAEMPLATQIVLSIPALGLSPATVIPAGQIFKGAKAIDHTISAVLGAGKLKGLKIPAKVLNYAYAGALETGISAIPRALVDDVFTPEDMKNEILFGTAGGVVIPAVVKGFKVTKSSLRMKKHTEQLADAQKKLQAETEARTRVQQPKVKQVKQPTQEPLVKEDGTTVPQEEPIQLDTDVELTERQRAVKYADDKVANMLDDYEVVTLEQTATESITGLGGTAQSMTQTLLQSNSKVLNFIGSKILELPQGFGGKKIRSATATLMQSSKSLEYRSMAQPQYHKLIGEYAAESGAGVVAKFNAQHMNADANDVVNAFSRDLAEVIESRRQGRASRVESPAVIQMADNLETAMIKMFNDQVEAGVSGFSIGKRIKNYFPQLWNGSKMRGAITTHGKETVVDALSKGYLSSKHNQIVTMTSARKQAVKFVDDVLEDKAITDHAMPATTESRARTRLDIDSTQTSGNLSVLDLMDIDTSTVLAKYANRAAGNVATAKATGGGITGDLDWDAMRKTLISEGADEKQVLLFDDAKNIVYGRPTRKGLNTSVNEVKDAVAQTKMGGLGMAQLAEIGAVTARTMRFMFSDPKTFKKIWSTARESTEDVQLMKETQALSGVSNQAHLLDKQAIHLDTAKLEEISRVRKLTQQVLSSMTFGKWKAPAGYILAQGSGFNAIRRFERRLANASFLIDTAKHFKDGTGKMSRDRLKDIGLDPDSDALKRIFKEVVEYDENGILKTLNLDQWDKAAREEYHYAMYRDDATMVQQTIGGEAPAWVNKPMMTVLAQFKQMAIVANKKSLQRNLQFADKEAVMAVMMNMALAATTRTAKFATLGAAAYAVTGNDSELKNPLELDYLDPEKYVTQFGFFADLGHIGSALYKSFDEAGDWFGDNGAVKNVGQVIVGEVPMLDWAKDYTQLGTADTLQEQADAAKGVMILGNMQLMDTLVKALNEQLESFTDWYNDE